MDKSRSKISLREPKMGREAFKSRGRHPIVVVLDNLKSAHNVGTILRLADALLVEKVYICGNTICPPNAKLKISSRGAERWVPWEYSQSTLDVIVALKGRGYFLVAVEQSNESLYFDELTAPSWPVAVILGREYDGVSTEVLNAVDFVAELPIYGMANSINVSIAAGVMLYYLDRALRQAGLSS